MNDDKALLAAAGKAAGIELAMDARGFYEVIPGVIGNERVWNPLTDDGDALRLAVKLGIAVELHPAWVYARAVPPDHYSPWLEFTEGWGNTKEPYAATRRAIVRAAASLAKEGDQQ